MASRWCFSIAAGDSSGSGLDAEGGDLWDPEADQAFRDSLQRTLRPDIPYETVDAHVDDSAFAEIVAARYLTLTKEPVNA